MTGLQLGRINFAPLNRALIGFDQLFDTLEFRTTSNYPPYNIIKVDETNYLIEVAVAGFRLEDLTVGIQGDQLIIKGAKTKSEDKLQYLHQGLSARVFSHQFTVAEHMEITSATLADGVLSVKMERKAPSTKLLKEIHIKEI